MFMHAFPERDIRRPVEGAHARRVAPPEKEDRDRESEEDEGGSLDEQGRVQARR